jgi:hypothetical protein
MEPGLRWLRCAAVRRGDTLEVVTLHHTGETFTLAGADNVDNLAGFEDLSGQFLAHFVVGGVGGADFGHVTTRSNARLLEVALQRCGDLAGVDVTAGNLDGFVAVLFEVRIWVTTLGATATTVTGIKLLLSSHT